MTRVPLVTLRGNHTDQSQTTDPCYRMGRNHAYYRRADESGRGPPRHSRVCWRYLEKRQVGGGSTLEHVEASCRAAARLLETLKMS